MRSVGRGLPRQPRQTAHFEAMPYDLLPTFIGRLKASPPTWGRMALEMAILTAARSREVRGARWSEVDLEAGLWTIPAERMKNGKVHVVPISGAADKLFKIAHQLRRREDGLIFSSSDRELSDMTLLKVLRDCGLTCTVHGFRSSFRDWVAERTDTASEVAEAALAHTVADKTEAAYRRTDYLEKRACLMEQWASFVDTHDAKLIDFPAASQR